jgi:hypothetical protein
MTDETPERIRVGFKSAVVIVAPFIWDRFNEQLKACLPVSLYLGLFQMFVLQKPVDEALVISFGIFIVMLGLMFFMEGLKLGLMPFGENIGSTLPRKSTLTMILLFAFCTGLGATFAEPAIGTLKQAGAGIDATKAPLLYTLLNDWSGILVTCVGIGVGLATVLGILRFLKSWSLTPMIIPNIIILAVLSLIAFMDDKTAAIIGLAWDCGGVTTGPVTVPLVLALGMGVTSSLGEEDTGMSGFGIVTLASLFPIIAVLSLSLIMHHGGLVNYDEIIAQASMVVVVEAPSIWDNIFIQGGILALQAIVPLCIFLYCVQRFLLKEEIRYFDQIILGIIFAVLGMALFNVGLTLGLSALGEQVGGTVPTAFDGGAFETPQAESLYGATWGRIIAIIFALVLGYGATLAEPALNALGMTVEEITAGAFKKGLLMQSVAFGVAIGIGSGITKLIFDIPLVYMLLPPYMLLIVLTLLSSEKFVNIGWDSAGVTTGPITVPLVIAMGLGVGNSVGVVEGFGIISMASVCPIISVLTLGLIVERANKKAQEIEQQGGPTAEAAG